MFFPTGDVIYVFFQYIYFYYHHSLGGKCETRHTLSNTQNSALPMA